MRAFNKKGSISYHLGEELLDEVLEGALSVIMILFGISYFNIENNWVEASRLLAQEAGATGVISEASLMYQTVTNSWLFQFLKVHGDIAMLLLAIVALLGIIAKFLTVKNKGRLIKDFGKIILVPGVVGFTSVIIIMLITTSSVNDFFARTGVTATGNLLANIGSGTLIFNMMGILFLIGLMTVIVGSILYFVVRSLGGKPVWMLLLAKFLNIIGFFSLGFFILIRLLAIEEFAGLLYGTEILKIFSFVWYITRSSFIVTMLIFAFGYVLYTYGKNIEKMHNRKMKEMNRRRQIEVLRNTPQMGNAVQPMNHTMHNNPSMHQNPRPYNPNHRQYRGSY